MKNYFRSLKKKMVVKKYVERCVNGIQFLMRNGDDVNVLGMLEDIIGQNITQEFKAKILKYLNKKDVNGFSSIMYAAVREDLDMAVLAINSSVDINKQDVAGYTALMYACRFNRGADLVKMLLDNNADIHITTANGKTALDYARYNKNLDIISLLSPKGKEPALEPELKHEKSNNTDGCNIM